nr:MAG TPA: regulatory protein [Caudoviricetes sp.]
MNELTVFEQNGQLLTDSREVAELIGKQHKNLLADIRAYCDYMNESTELNFQPSDFFISSTYKDSTGRELPCYLLTKKGCDMVANKMTGQKGVLFTAAYVNAFHAMEEHIKSGGKTPLPNNIKQALAEAKLNNSRARVSNMWLKIADKVSIPEYREICASYASNALAGHEVIPLPAATEHLYTATEIGELLGGLDKAKVGRLANQHNLKTPEYGKFVWDKSPHSNKQVESFRYNEKALAKFQELLRS